jgi:Flp pilus assembly protein TadG
MKRGLKRNSAQSGQAIVLIAIAMIVLLAFVVLALDGGRFYTQRRTSQNASDMAALAGVYVFAKAKQTGTTVSDQQVLKEVNRVAEINEIADTNGVVGDAINGNVLAWWVDGSGNILRQITTSSTQYPPATTAAVKVQTQIPYQTFIGGLVGHANLTAQSDAKARIQLTTIKFEDNTNSIYTGGGDCDNWTDRIDFNYSNTNTAAFTNPVYIDGSLAVSNSVTATYFGNSNTSTPADITVRVLTAIPQSGQGIDGPYKLINPANKNPFPNSTHWNYGSKYVPAQSPVEAPKGFPKWSYLKVNGVDQFVDANSWKPGSGIVYQQYVSYYNIPPDTFFNTIPVGATPAETLANVNAAYSAGKRGIYWIDGDLIVTNGTPYWHDVSLIVTGRFQSADPNHEFYSAGDMGFNISVLAGKDYGMPYRCASDRTKWVFSVTGNNNQFFGVIYVPYGQMYVQGNTSGGVQFSRGIVTYSAYLGSADGSANSWQFSFDPDAFVQYMPTTELIS